VPAVLFVVGEFVFLKFNRVEWTDILTLLAESAELGVPLEGKFSVAVHAASAFFPALLAVARAYAAHGEVFDRSGITSIDVAFGMSTHDHPGRVVNGRGNSDILEDGAGLDQDVVLAVEAVSQNYGRAAGEMVQTVLVRHFDVVQTHDPDCIRDERLCPGLFDRVNDFADHDRGNNSERALRTPMGLDRNPLVLFETLGKVHLPEKRLKFSRNTVFVVPFQGTCGGEVDFGHGRPHD